MGEFTTEALFGCRNCRNQIAGRENLVSKNFQAKSGRAYMFSHAMNIVVGKTGNEQLPEGLFSIADIFCSNCGEAIGWKYVKAYNESQKFMEGKLVVELVKIAKLY